MRVTTKEIAQICGVSVGTVDRALNNRSGINEQTRERILAVAKQMGYRPHLLARGLVTGSTKTIGVVVLTLHNPFFSELVEVIQKKAYGKGYHVFLMLSEFDEKAEEESLNRLRALNVDGIIISPVGRGNAFSAYLKRLSTPVVTVSNRVLKSWPWVGIDERAAAKDAVLYAISKGYTRVIFITQSRERGKAQSLYVDEERLLGYRAALREAGIVPEVYADTEIQQMIAETRDWSSRRTCLVCTCDAVALDTLDILKTHHVLVPDNVGLVGFDNLDELKYISPRLTTVSYPIETMGELAFDCLMAGIENRPMASHTLAHSIVPGGTV
jgi:LacI family transcriptional regulator